MSAYSDLVLTLSPELYYQCEESAGATTLVDSSTNGFDGPTAVPVAVDTANLPAGFTTAIDFGSDNNADVPDPLDFVNQTLVYTICWWGKLPVNNSQFNGVAGCTLGSSPGWAVYANDAQADNSIRHIVSSTATTHTFDNGVADSTMHFYVLRSAGPGLDLELIIDGGLFDTTTAAGAVKTGVNADLRFGACLSSGGGTLYPSNSTLCQFHVHPTALTDQNITDLYAAGGNTEPAGPPVVDTQPTNQAVLEGFPAMLTSAATSDVGGMTSQWYLAPSTLLTGETSDILVVETAVGETTNNGYFNRYTDSVGSVDTDTAIVAITPHGEGIFVTFTAHGGGSPVLTYQWYENGIEMAGETAPTLTVQANGANEYYFIVTNACGFDQSNSVRAVPEEA